MLSNSKKKLVWVILWGCSIFITVICTTFYYNIYPNDEYYNMIKDAYGKEEALNIQSIHDERTITYKIKNSEDIVINTEVDLSYTDIE